MIIWHPGCKSTSFFYTLVEKKEVNNTVEVTDHMKCKICNFEFNISWPEEVRDSWLSETQPRSFKRK